MIVAICTQVLTCSVEEKCLLFLVLLCLLLCSRVLCFLNKIERRTVKQDWEKKDYWLGKKSFICYSLPNQTALLCYSVCVCVPVFVCVWCDCSHLSFSHAVPQFIKIKLYTNTHSNLLKTDCIYFCLIKHEKCVYSTHLLIHTHYFSKV